MGELVDFLRVRLDEREQNADCIHDLGCGGIRYDGTCDCGEPERVLREVEAKRRTLDEHAPYTRQASWDEEETICDRCRYDEGLDTYVYPCPTVLLLALPDADHPDYDQEWNITRARA